MKNTIQLLFLFLKYGYLGGVLENDRECFVSNTGIDIEEYLPEYMKCQGNIVLRGHNFPVLKTDAFSDIQCDSLSLSLNNIEAINQGAFSESSVTALDLSENLLKCIFRDRIQIVDMDTLNLSKNKITYIEPGSFPSSLSSLDLSFNSITEFDMENFASCGNFQELHLAHNGLVSVNLKKDLMNKLEKLDLSYNNLHQYDFSDLVNLLHLNLKHNKLRQLRKLSFLNLDSLEELDLSNNKLEEIHVMLNLFPNLTTLKLQNNYIKHIPDNLFLNSIHLRELDLSYNSLQSFNFSNNELRKLWRLKMNNMELRNIHASQLLNLNALYELELSNNLLLEFDADINIPTLWKLDLSYNRLTRIKNNFVNLNALGSLDLSHNSIYFFNIRNCALDKVWKVKLNDNNIVRIRDNNFPDFKALLFLDLSNNNLKTSSIPEDKFQRLRVLDMSFNNISYYDEDTFNSLSSLRFLSLRNNYISHIPSKLLYENPNMIYLDISYNLITSFKYDRKETNTSLKTFNIFGNPINCLHRGKIDMYCSRNKIELDSCDASCRADGRTPICVNYDCDCDNVFSPLTEMYLEKVPRNKIRSCSFDVLTQNIV